MPLDPSLGCPDVQLQLTELALSAVLSVPAAPGGLVIFVHGTGSNCSSPRNQRVAQALQRAGFATLLFDLLTGPEQRDACSHDVDLSRLSQRLLTVIDALQTPGVGLSALSVDLARLPLGLFGSSSGAAVALAAAARGVAPIQAIVSRGGRPDLVQACLPQVLAPTLLLVGSHDIDVLELNTWAAARLQVLHELRVVPGAGHLFAEPGALDLVARWSRDWFLRFLSPSAASSPCPSG